MRPQNLSTKIFLDSGNPEETKQILELLGFLDGQTTNPSLVVKNPQIKTILDSKGKFTETELINFYKEVIQKISNLIPEGSVSIEVYADENSIKEDLIAQANVMNTWIPNAHIKYPTTKAGLRASEESIQNGQKVNMTLVFTQEQGASVASATNPKNPGDVFISPFVGRLDDIGLNGVDLIKNIRKMYDEKNSNVQVLAASVRTLDQFLACIHYKADIITAPFSVLKTWAEAGMPLPAEDFSYNPESLEPIEYKDIEVDRSYLEYNIKHELTDKGLKKFAEDWNGLLN